MSFKFSKLSEKNLSEAHPKLQELFREVIKYIDCAVIEGHRTKEEQNKSFEFGRSKLSWPNSKHNTLPSLAVDVVPCPIDWEDTTRFYYFAGIVLGIAFRMGIKVTFGGDWDRDHSLHEHTLVDLPHFELVEE